MPQQTKKKIILIIFIIILLILGILLIFLFIPKKSSIPTTTTSITTTSIYPKITICYPSPKSVNIPSDLDKIIIGFDQNVDVGNFSLTIQPGGDINEKEQSTPNQLTFYLPQNTSANTKYSIKLQGKSIFLDLSGTQTNQLTWDFTTGDSLSEDLEDSL
jgi:hypothetical protein